MKKQDGAHGTRRFARGVGEWLSYANVMSTIAVFGVLGGGGAYAASKIGPNDVKRDAVRFKHIKNGTIVSRDINRKTRAALRGRQGPKGATGASGPVGPKGDTGPSAPAGPNGDAGGFAANCNEGLAVNDVMVRVGSVCIDRYEASIWTARTGGSQITGAIPCSPNGQDCTNIYARSVAGVTPRGEITWFQAQQALANSGKRLPSNAEWQMAVAGTPDSTACNVSTGSAQNTGQNARCISNHGTNDMVGNVWEWVADWDEQASASACTNWAANFGSDVSCIGRGEGEPSTHTPGALLRGGTFLTGTISGPFAVQATVEPSSWNNYFGFRGAR